jgi:Flp pilus assembly protein TadG
MRPVATNDVVRAVRRCVRRVRWSDDRGFAGGTEAVPLGVLVMVVGTLLVMNVWAVIDTKMALNVAARQAAHAVAEAPDAGTATATADDAAREALAAFHGPERAAGLVVSGIEYTDRSGVAVGFQRCARVRVVLEDRAPLIRVPIIGGWGTSFPVSSTGASIVDPYRLDVAAAGSC